MKNPCFPAPSHASIDIGPHSNYNIQILDWKTGKAFPTHQNEHQHHHYTITIYPDILYYSKLKRLPEIPTKEEKNDIVINVY